jgi:hypothetical protein
MVSNTLLDCPPTAYEVKQEDYQGHHEQQMDQPPSNVEHAPAEGPRDEKNHG